MEKSSLSAPLVTFAGQGGAAFVGEGPWSAVGYLTS